MRHVAGPLLLTLFAAGEVSAEPPVKDVLRAVSGLADQVVGRAQFIEQQFRQKSTGVEARGRQARRAVAARDHQRRDAALFARAHVHAEREQVAAINGVV